MKRLLVVFALGVLLAAQVGCQSGLFMKLSHLQPGYLPLDDLNEENDDESFAGYYRQPLPALPKKVNDRPDYENIVVTHPLGYRRGNLRCNT